MCRDDSGVDSLIGGRREAVFSLLVKYIGEIETFNPALSLVGTNTRQELIIRHILDSLAPLPILLKYIPPCADQTAPLARQAQIADVGSGAGLPGIPLAVVMPNAQFTLIERMGRRAGFLRNTCAALGLGNVAVEEAEMEKAQRGRFDLLTFRAFKPLEPKVFKKLFRLCAAEGTLAAYKGRREKISAEMAALEKALPDISGRWEIIPCPVPFLDEERHLALVR